VEQTLQTKSGAKTCALDEKTDRVIVITREAAPGGGDKGGDKGKGKGKAGGAQLLDVIFIGR
jgi:hypothetical protein